MRKRKKTKKKAKVLIATSMIAAGAMGYAGGSIDKPCDCNQNKVKVTSVIDGDTIKIKGGEKVRLIGINAPERGECYYKESKKALAELVKGKTVRLDKDISEKDRYDRLLRYASLVNPGQDNVLVNQYMASNGLAKDAPSAPDNRYKYLLVSAREKAKRDELGLWNECEIENEANKLREQDAETSDPDCIIKGNISEKGFGKTYLIPGCDNYNRVKIDTRKGEAYFCSEKEALEAGFRKASNCPE